MKRTVLKQSRGKITPKKISTSTLKVRGWELNPSSSGDVTRTTLFFLFPNGASAEVLKAYRTHTLFFAKLFSSFAIK